MDEFIQVLFLKNSKGFIGMCLLSVILHSRAKLIVSFPTVLLHTPTSC